MPNGYEFSQEIKQLMFNVIDFVESEKNGSVIPLNDVNDRLKSMLGISMASVERLRREMREEKNRIAGEQKKVDKAKQNKENQELEMARRFRHARSTSSSSSVTSSSTITNIETTIPVATPPCKFDHSDRPPITLSEEEQKNIRQVRVMEGKVSIRISCLTITFISHWWSVYILPLAKYYFESWLIIMTLRSAQKPRCGAGRRSLALNTRGRPKSSCHWMLLFSWLLAQDILQP